MLFVVGLGNPGSEYAGTRHNVGFEVLALLAERFSFPSAKSQFGADIQKGKIGSTQALLVAPMTFMNLSGNAVGALLRYYKGSEADLLVVHDDLDFEPGMVRIKNSGGHGGHNGLRSIISHAGRNFARIRLGVGKPRRGSGADYVLGRIAVAERPLMDAAVRSATDAVELVANEGLQTAMNYFNRRRDSSDENTT